VKWIFLAFDATFSRMETVTVGPAVIFAVVGSVCSRLDGVDGGS
jgi:hypothetical protein